MASIKRADFLGVFTPLAREVHELLTVSSTRKRFQERRNLQPHRNNWRFPPAEPINLTEKYIWLGTVHDLCCCPNEPVFPADARDPVVVGAAVVFLYGEGTVSIPFGDSEGEEPGQPFRHPEHLRTLEAFLCDVKADLAARLKRESELELDARAQRVRVGEKWYDISDEQKSVLSVLFEAKGAWVSGPALGKRPDKTIRAMPPEVQEMVESHQRNGYRIPALLPK